METVSNTKILILDNKRIFAWVNVDTIGEILITSHKLHKTDTTLSVGKYRFYSVKDEPDLTDLEHLELHTGNGIWQGYLLPTGLPDDQKKKNRIIPTVEVITKSID